jgi:methylated-DNA-[protein]-cysteine S-methyltransferase
VHCYTTMESPVGALLLRVRDGMLVALSMSPWRRSDDLSNCTRDDAQLATTVAQLREYFDGTRTEFDLQLAPEGTPFQQEVWRALREVPYGTTTTYGALARQLGRPDAARAVGMANGRNPIGIVIPCHRVIGSDGTLTGYGGGLPRKRWLLEHESDGALRRRVPPPVPPGRARLPGPAHRADAWREVAAPAPAPARPARPRR